MSPSRVRVGAGGSMTADRPRWEALCVCLTASFMTLLDVSIVNVALPSIQHGLGAAPADLSWVVSGYALTFGLVLVPAGRFGDQRGRKNAFVLGIALFTLASAFCGLAQSPGWLVASRLVQGAAAGWVTPQVFGLIQQMFEGARRARAFGMLGSVVGIATAVGPVAGGLLIEAFGTGSGWRWVFYVNLPIGIAATALAPGILPSKTTDERPVHTGFDRAGVLLLGAGVVCVMLPFVQEQQWRGRGKWLLIPLGALVLAAFWRWEGRQEQRGRTPALDLRLFRLRSFSLGALLATVYFAGFTTVFFIYSLFLQSGLRYSALQAGLAVVPFAVGSGFAAAAGGRLVVRYGRRLVVHGLLGVVLGLVGALVAVRLVPGHGAPWATALPLLLAGLGSGLTIAPNTALTLTEVPVELAGAAAGVLQTGQRIGTAAGIAAVGAVFFAHVANHHDWAGALRLGFATVVFFVLAALVVALADLRASRRTAAR
ncbi:MFS transporter [Streptoverticillium reticulum]|uniref:MFS transporter n=1 Tax=Streptoverticillium reticulum TaxID=1433415 RepID=UPI0039BF1323